MPHARRIGAQQKAGQVRQIGDLVERFSEPEFGLDDQAGARSVCEEALAAATGLGLDGPMKFRLVCCLSIVAPLAASCGRSSSNPDGGGTGPVGNVVMRDVNSYTSVSSLTIPIVQTQSGADLEVCWGAITQDILCHDITAAADINNVSFLQIPGCRSRWSATSWPRARCRRTTSRSIASSTPRRRRRARRCHSSPSARRSSPRPTTSPPRQQDVHAAVFRPGPLRRSGAKTMLFLDPVASSTTTMVAAPASAATSSASGQPDDADAAADPDDR